MGPFLESKYRPYLGVHGLFCDSMFEVVLFVCSESVSPAVSCCKEDRIQPLLLCGMEPQSITFGLEGHPVNLRRFFP